MARIYVAHVNSGRHELLLAGSGGRQTTLQEIAMRKKLHCEKIFPENLVGVTIRNTWTPSPNGCGLLNAGRVPLPSSRR
jgi:hypothetical protein